MPQPIELFRCLTAQFEVEVVPPTQDTDPAILRFTPSPIKKGDASIDLFERWFRTSAGTPPVPRLLNLLLALANPVGSLDAAYEAKLLEAAREAGPLFTLLPGRTAIEWLWSAEDKRPAIEEPVTHWVKAANQLNDLIRALQQQNTASTDGSRKARRRRGVAQAEAALGATLNEMGEEERQQMIAAYTPSPRISARDEVSAEVGAIIDRLWFLPLNTNEPGLDHLRFPRLRLSEPGMALQFDVPFGIQALLIMALHDQSLGRTLVPRTCARELCRKVTLMSPRQRYCSILCQRSEAVRRYRTGKPKSKQRTSPTRRAKNSQID